MKDTWYTAFDTHIQNIPGVDNIVDNTLSRLPFTYVDKYKSSRSKYQCCAKKLLAIGRVENRKYCFLLDLLNVQIEQQKELRNNFFQTQHTNLGSRIRLLQAIS